MYHRLVESLDLCRVGRLHERLSSKMGVSYPDPAVPARHDYFPAGGSLNPRDQGTAEARRACNIVLYTKEDFPYVEELARKVNRVAPLVEASPTEIAFCLGGIRTLYRSMLRQPEGKTIKRLRTSSE